MNDIEKLREELDLVYKVGNKLQLERNEFERAVSNSM